MMTIHKYSCTKRYELSGVKYPNKFRKLTKYRELIKHVCFNVAM